MVQADIPTNNKLSAKPLEMTDYFSKVQLARAFGAKIVRATGGSTCIITQGKTDWKLTTMGNTGREGADFKDKNISDGKIACTNQAPDNIFPRGVSVSHHST